MKKFKSKEHLKNYRRYHIPGCGNLMSVKTNVISINKHNSRENEDKKLFEEEVSMYIQDGWHLVGGVSFDANYRWYFQALSLSYQEPNEMKDMKEMAKSLEESIKEHLGLEDQ